MKKNIFMILFTIITIITILLSTSVISVQEYSQMGAEFGDYNIPVSNKFNSKMEDDLAFFFPLTNVHGSPLVKDLDGDGTQEIIVNANNNIWLFNFSNNQLTFVTGIAMDSQETDKDLYSNMLTFDYDSDGKHEVIIHQQENSKLYVFEWNGTHFFLDKNWTAIGVGCPFANCNFASDSMIGCGHANGCIIVWGNGNYVRSSGQYETYVTQFDSTLTNVTARTNTLLSYSGVGGNRQHCFPRMANIHYSQQNTKYYFTTQRPFVASYLWEIDVNASPFPVDDSVISGETIAEPTGSQCSRGVDTITSATSGLFLLTPTTYEIGYGFQEEIDKFRMIVYKEDLSVEGVFPAIEKGEGELKSNPFMASAFPRSDIRGRQHLLDMCIVGYSESRREVTVLCATGTYDLDGFIRNVEFVYALESTQVNVTGNQIYTLLSHSVESDTNNKQDEVLTPYGVFELDDYSQINPITDFNCRALGNCEMNLIYANPINEETALIMADVEGNDNPDIISLQTNSMAYIDDGFINRPAYFGYCTEIRPSIDDTWLFEGTSRITLRPFDADGDSVRGRVIWYEGLTGELIITEYLRFINNSQIITGENELGNVSLIQEIDGLLHEVKEATLNGNESLEIIYNITGLSPEETPCDNRFGINVTVFYEWRGESSDNLTMAIYNFSSDTWFNLTDLYKSGSLFKLIDYKYIGNITQFIKNGTARIRFIDNRSWADASDDKFRIDLLTFSCFNETLRDLEIDSDWSPWFAEASPISITNSPLTPIGENFNLKLMIQDIGTNQTVSEEFTFDVDTVNNSGINFLQSASCLGMTVEEYENFIAGGEQTCLTNDDCEDGSYCSSGSCLLLPTCETSSDCPSDFACIQTSCEEIPSGADSSVSNAIKGFAFFSGISTSVFVLILLMFLSWAIFRSETVGNNVKIPMILITGLFGLAIAVKLLLVNVIWLILFILLIISIIGVFIGGFIRSQRAGG